MMIKIRAPLGNSLRLAAAGSLLALAACGDSHGGDNAGDTVMAANGFTPPMTQMPKPLPGQAQTTPLTAYVGRYPHEAVGGVDFYDRSDVATALVAAVGDEAVRNRIRARSGPETPIFARGGKVAAWGCEAHNCGDHNWTVMVGPIGRAQVCYHDAATMGDRSRWYTGDAPVLRAGACPAEE